MIRGDTIPISLTCAQAQFTQATNIVVTISQADVSYNFTPTVISDTEIQVQMTQAQSLEYKKPSLVYPLKIQFNYLLNGVRMPSYVTEDTVGEQLYNEVMS